MFKQTLLLIPIYLCLANIGNIDAGFKTHCNCSPKTSVEEGCRETKDKHENKDPAKMQCIPYNSTEQICCSVIKHDCCERTGKLHDNPECNAGEYTVYPDPCNCTKYYQCASATINQFNCPFGGAFEVTGQGGVCTRINKIPPTFCHRRPFKEAVIPFLYIEPTKITVKNNITGTILGRFTQVVRKGTAYDVMLVFQAMTSGQFNFETTFNPLFWRSVSSMMGLPANYAVNRTWWSFSVNGVSSAVGISSYIVEANDHLEFGYQQAAVHDG